MRDIEWKARRDICGNVEFLAAVPAFGGRPRAIGRAVLEFATLEEGPHTVELIEPTLKLSEGAAQSLLEALWREGFRPKEEPPSAPILEAQRAHVRFAENITLRLIGIVERDREVAR
jgi:hypothetical protein